jgi:hypothetical protein
LAPFQVYTPLPDPASLLAVSLRDIDRVHSATNKRRFGINTYNIFLGA